MFRSACCDGERCYCGLSRLCHAVLGADIGVIVCFMALLVWFGWLLVIEYGRPFAGAIVLALSIITFAVNKRDAERALCGPDVKHERQQNTRDYPSDNRLAMGHPVSRTWKGYWQR